MASSKDLFLRGSDEDVKAALAITKSIHFDKLIAFSRAEFAQLMPTHEMCMGVNKFVDILSTIADEDSPDVEPIESGLKHDLSIPPRDVVQSQQTK